MAGAKADVLPTFSADYPFSIFSVSFVFCVTLTVLWGGATSICDGIIDEENSSKTGNSVTAVTQDWYYSITATEAATKKCINSKHQTNSMQDN